MNPRVSLAIPLYNEEDVLPELLQRARRVLDETPGGPHEIVFADDGSHDRTRELLRRAAAEDPRIVVVALARNFGHQTAIGAALDHTSGDVVLVMDGDLQDPPEALPEFLDKYDEGYDVVYARRVARKESAWLRACYFLFYRLIAALSDLRLPLDSGDFALLSRRTVDALRALPEQHRYLRELADLGRLSSDRDSRRARPGAAPGSASTACSSSSSWPSTACSRSPSFLCDSPPSWVVWRWYWPRATRGSLWWPSSSSAPPPWGSRL